MSKSEDAELVPAPESKEFHASADAVGDAPSSPGLPHLRAEAWRFSVPPEVLDAHAEALSQASVEGSLAGLLGSPSPDLGLQAAYLLSLSAPPPQGIGALRNVLRINGGDPVLRRQAYARLGDLLAAQGDSAGAGEAYIKALSRE